VTSGSKVRNDEKETPLDRARGGSPGGLLGGIGGDEAGSTPTAQYEIINVDPGADTNITNTDSGFRFDGTIGIQARRTPRTFEGVHICLYDSDEALIEAHRIGTMGTTENNYRNVTVETDQYVHYVIVDHPGFRTYQTSSLLWLVYDPEFDQYRSFGALDVSLEYDVDEMKGGCAEVSEA